MTTLMLCADRANHRALANRLHQAAPLAHVALVEPAPAKHGPTLITRVASATIARPLRSAWGALFRGYDDLYPDYPEVPISRHRGVNSETILELVARLEPSLVIVSGTDLLRKPLIDAICRKGRVINLHTGISPYVKGAPNCTNWALSLGEFDMIGNSIMWLDAGIDSGNLIATERSPLTGKESLAQLHRTVMDHAHELYCRAYLRIIEGLPMQSVAQDSIDRGRLFLTRQWTALPMMRAIINFATRYSPKSISAPRNVQLVSLMPEDGR